MRKRPDWDEYFLNIAEAVAARGDCTRRMVGAVFTYENRILATGYNGTPASGQPSCPEGACPRGTKTPEELPGYQKGNHDYSDCIAVHAEMNALEQFKEWASMTYFLISRGKHRIPNVAWAGYFDPAPILYVTCMPCDGCTKELVKAGIVEVRWPEGGWRQDDHK